jgi:PilZ domain
MFGKRMDGVERLRRVLREPLLLAASILTIERSRSAVILDVSQSGARLRGSVRAAPGQDLWLRVGCVDTLATVAWTDGDICGVTFDQPLGEDDLDHLRREAKNTIVATMTPEERLAAQDWAFGFAR